MHKFVLLAMKHKSEICTYTKYFFTISLKLCSQP